MNKNLKDLVLNNRSYRKFDESKKISRKTLLDLIDIARLTPSSVNMQAIKYFISNTDEINNIIRPHTYWAKMLKDFDHPRQGENPSAYIIVCVDKNIVPSPDKFDKDVGIVAQTIMLAAVEIGYGGCMIGSFDADILAEKLNIPNDMALRLVLALGVPDEKIILETLKKDSPFQYYRDENDVHHVPKRKLEDIILN